MEHLLESIKKEYGVSISRAEKLNIGLDQHTAIYKLFSQTNEIYFLKIRSGNFNELCVNIPFWISTKLNSPHLIDPIKTINNKLFVKISSFYLMLFPFINGQSGWDVSLTKEQFYGFGKFMFNLHSIDLPEKYLNCFAVETYNGIYRNSVKNVFGKIENGSNNIIKNFLDVLYENKKIVIEMIDYLEKVISEIDKKSKRMCLCHGDIHAGNLLINQDNFYIVDWDTIILAPKEKDLMFIGGGIGNKWKNDEEIEYFYKGYGKKLRIDNNLIKYYRYERIIQDIYEFHQQIMNIETNEEERKLCFKLFKEQFEPDNVVETALKT
jgi:spectinomycin phosphotransferase